MKHARAEVESGVGIMKVVRKAREERQLKRTKKDKKGKGTHDDE